MKHRAHPGVYAIRHLASGRAYIGSTKNVYARWRGHLSDLRRGTHHSPHLQNAWRKYGESAFVFEVLEVCLPDPIALAAREQIWIDRMGRKLFNSSKTVEASCSRKRSEEERRAISARMMGNKHGAGTHYHGKLTEANVVEIMHRYARGEESQAIADVYGIEVTEVTRIASRKIWWRVAVAPKVEAACLARVKMRGTPCNRKITFEIAETIRRRCERGEHQEKIAAEHGISQGLVSAIRAGRIWVKPQYTPIDVPLPSSPVQPSRSPILNATRTPNRRNYVTAPRPERVAIGCSFCGAGMIIQPCKIRKHKAHYCSKDCKRGGMSQRMKMVMADPAQRERLAAANRGKRHTQETRAKMSKAHQARLQSADQPVAPNTGSKSGPPPASQSSPSSVTR